jgi:uncharacterized membrane protein YdjX (TVP38/TMEM64 family)
MAMAAGAICGFMPGFLLATAAIPIGVVLSFALSRSLFRPAIERLTARRRHLCNLDALIDQVGWRLVSLPRISPIMPFSATSFALGLSRIGLGSYMFGTPASLPTLCGYVFAGKLADSGLSVFAQGAPGPLELAGRRRPRHLAALPALRLGQIAIKLGLAPRPVEPPRQEHAGAPLWDGRP